MTLWTRTGYILAAGILLFVSGVTWAKDREAIPTPPPMAKNSVASVFLKEPTEITLSVAGRVVEPLTFLIRKPPGRGVLSGLRRTGKTSAAVVYTPDPDAGTGDDSFTFAAKSPDSPVSAPARVWIQLVEKPPVLEHVEEIDFGRVYLGDRVEKDFVLRNSGGGRAIGQIKLNRPWSAAETLEYDVRSGSEVRLRLVFQPLEEGAFRDTVQLGKLPGPGLIVRGEGAAPIKWAEDGLVFGAAERASGRATFSITNQTDAHRTATFEWPDFLEAATEVSLPPQGTSLFDVAMRGPVSGDFGGGVTVRSGNFVGLLPLTIHPGPAKIVTVPDGILDLGKISADAELKGTFVVKNSGESDAPLEIKAPNGVRILPNPQNLILEPGGSREFEIQLSPPNSGPLRIVVLAGSPGTTPARLEVRAAAKDTPATALPVERFLTVPDPNSNELSPQPKKSPRVESIELVRSTKNEIEIAWDIPSGDYVGFRLQRRAVSPSASGEVAVNWIDWDGEKISMSNGRATATLTRLPADRFWMIRILGVNPAGALSEPSPVVRIATAKRQPLIVPAWAWFGLGSAAVAGLAHLAIRRRRALMAQEDEKLSRLEAE